MKRTRLGFVTAGSTAFLAVMLVGCQDKLTHERFSQIQQNASTSTEVTALLGEPSHKLGESWYYERPEKHVTVIIDFDKAGSVSRKQWIDAMSAQWEDTK
ncbi:MAG: hypothetical protein KJ749_14210 [Planctomycetes bacterium]|nr:hypothetical protein [Planctomycetota bacterium]